MVIMERFRTPSSHIEIDRFKAEINLSEFASARGYQWDKHNSSRNSIIMRHPNGDKIIIARSSDNHWIYFSARNQNDSGTIIDFVQNRDGVKLGDVRNTLRPWIGESKPFVAKELYQPTVTPVQKDRQGVMQRYVRMEELENPAYLISRGISKKTLHDVRFQGMIKQDARNNIIFPHYDKDGLSGYEIKNKDFTGFASGGIKSVWHSRVSSHDNKLVITESAIDALSYHQIHGDSFTRYLSIAGQFNPEQKEKILPAAMNKMPKGSIVVMAFDKDNDGKRFAEELKPLAPAHVTIKRHTPTVGKDWNDQLQSLQRERNNELSKAAQGMGMGMGIVR
jgi:hypothetical protein